MSALGVIRLDDLSEVNDVSEDHPDLDDATATDLGKGEMKDILCLSATPAVKLS